MKQKIASIFAASLLTVLTAVVATPNCVFSDSGVRVVTIEGHRKRFDIPTEDAVQRYLLIDITNGDRDGDGVQDFQPLEPVAVLLLLTGGDGRLRLDPDRREDDSFGFPVHTRYHFAAEGFIVAAMDAASDFLVHNHASIVDPPGSRFVHGSGLDGHRLPLRGSRR